MFQAVQHLELDTLGLETIRDFLKKRARYLRLVAQHNKADDANVTPITVVASIDPKLLEILIDMEKIDADSVDDCTDESVMEFLESTRERDASVTAEFVKAEVLAKVTFAMSEKYSALRVMKAVADHYSLHRNLRLDFINGKPKMAVEHLVSVIRPATLKALIESKLEMDKPELKKDFLEFVEYLEEMAIIHDEYCHVVEQKKTGDSGTKNNGTMAKATTLAAAVLDTTLEEAHMKVPATRRLTVTERSLDMEGRRNRRALESSRPESRRLASTRRSVRARITTCLTVHTLERTKLWSCCPNTRKKGMPTRRRTSRLWARTERRRKTEMARPRISRQRISESRSRYWQTQALTTPLYRAVLWRTQGSVVSLARSRCCRSPSC
jgi:hypothetical protein